MADTTQIPLKQENIPAMMDKHAEKIDRAVDYDSDTQQARLKLFEHDPPAMAAHYPELQAKSEELRKQNDAIQRTAGLAGWAAFAATAAATAYAVTKKKLIDSKLIKGIFVLFSSITAGFAANFLTDRVLGARVRDESKDLAEASRKAYQREVGVYMEDTQRKLHERIEQEKQKAAGQVETATTTEQPVPVPSPSAENKSAENKMRGDAQMQKAPASAQPEAEPSWSGNVAKPVEGHVAKVEQNKAAANDASAALRA